MRFLALIGFVTVLLGSVPAAMAGLVVRTDIISSGVYSMDNTKWEFEVEVRAGWDSMGTAPDIGSFRMKVTTDVAPFSVTVVRATAANNPTADSATSWSHKYTKKQVDIYSLTEVELGGDYDSGAPLNTDPLTNTVMFGPNTASGLISTVKYLFARPLVGTLDVTFTPAALPDTSRVDSGTMTNPQGFITHTGVSTYSKVSTAYIPQTGTISGLSAVPEPTSFSLVFGALLYGVARRRRTA
ncbi:MAG: PEP-CTERM sorting domain-containing protein [Planctomycetota bacterium]|nr:MAG: PEP-CTERM sorting domain-containing protein [Planctomycetota bacterium]